MRGRRVLVPGWVRRLSPNPLTTPITARDILAASKGSCPILCSLPPTHSSILCLVFGQLPSHEPDPLITEPDPLMTAAGSIQVNRSFKSAWNHKPAAGDERPCFNTCWCPLSKLPYAGDTSCLSYSSMWNTHYHHPKLSQGHTDEFSAGNLAKSKVSVRTW